MYELQIFQDSNHKSYRAAKEQRQKMKTKETRGESTAFKQEENREGRERYTV